MFGEEWVGDVAVDAVPALEEIRLEVLLEAEELPSAARLVHGSLHVVDGKDIIAHAMFDQAGARRDQGGEIAQLSEIEQTRHEIAGAMEDLEDAFAPVAEVAGDDTGFDARIDGGGEEGVHSAAADAHGADTMRRDFVSRLEIIEQAHA